jgi:DNA (cytosine-5)-methyltransferase 1
MNTSFRHGSLFSGIGGFDLAAEWMGWENVFHCEWNDFGKKVLNHYWPNSISYHDITKTDFSIHRGTIDILTGGFPCQPYSSAGKRLGKEDERHLWPEMLRAIREIQPRWIVGENVLGLVNWNGGMVFEEVQADLETQGYEVQPYVLPAAAVNAPHRRDRVWFVAFKNTNKDGWRSEQRKEESCKWEQRNSCTGDNECISTNYEKVRTTSNSDNTRANNEMQINGEWKEKDKRWEGQPFSEHRQDGCDGNASDSDSIRLEHCKDGTKMGGGQTEMGRQRSELTNAIETDGEIRDVTNTNNTRFKTFNNKKSKLGKGNTTKAFSRDSFESIYTRNRWETFPTVSPICSRDDGLSNRLDGITFSKWRTESIKAGGNAIVPQVVFQIFKAIELFTIQNQ